MVASHLPEFLLPPPPYTPNLGTVYEFGGTYYSETDIHNKINSSLRDIEAAANGRQQEHPAAARGQSKDRTSFEQDGDMYLPRTTESYQTALYMKSTYGTDYSWRSAGEIGDRARGQDKYVIRTGSLDPQVREAAIDDLVMRWENATLAEDRAHGTGTAQSVTPPVGVSDAVADAAKAAITGNRGDARPADDTAMIVAAADQAEREHGRHARTQEQEAEQQPTSGLGSKVKAALNKAVHPSQWR